MRKNKNKISWQKKVRFIWQYAAKYRNTIILLILGAVFLSFANSITPFLFGKLVDLILGKEVLWGLAFWQIAAVWIVLEIIALILNEWQGFRSVMIEIRLEKDLVVDFCRHALRLPVNYHYNQKPGEVFKIIDRSSQAIYRIYDVVIYNLLPNFLTMLVAFIVMYFVNWILATIIFGTVFIYFILSLFFRIQKILANQRRINKSFNKVFGGIGDMLSNIFAVKMNTAERYEVADKSRGYNGIISLLRRQMIYWVQYGSIQGFLIRGSFVAVILTAVFLLSKNQLTAGELTMFVAYMAMIYHPLWFITHKIREMRKALVDLENAVEIRSEEKEKEYKGAKPIDLKGGIEFRRVYFSYPERDEGILAGVNFKIDPGNTLAIFGETGSGKTTIYNLILRLYEPDSGRILFDGIDFRKITLKSLRSQIAVVPQDPILFNESIYKNILYSNRKAKKNEVIRAAKVANAHDFIMKLPKGYDTKVGERGVKLSGGQVQRIAIARAVLQDPEILILDEATSSLDQKTKFEVLDALEKLIEGRTTIIITHDFSAITTKADNIIVLDNGKVVQTGNHERLLKKRGIYKNLYQTQQEHLV